MLKKISIPISLALIILLAGAFRPIAEEGIKLTVINLRSDKGFVLVSLFKDGVGYPDDVNKAFKTAKVSIKDRKASVLFPDLPVGNYAISILHDENNDQKMNKSFLGLPKEGYGFSNNAVGAFGPPSLSRANFRHTQNTLTQVTIRAKY